MRHFNISRLRHIAAALPGILPGFLAVAAVTACALLAARFFGGSSILWGLFIGMALHGLSRRDALERGISFSADIPLQIGTGLLGLQITAEQLSLLSAPMLSLIVSGVFLTIVFGTVLGKALHWPAVEGAIAGAAVAVCGASAAMAVKLVSPPKACRPESFVAVIIVVMALSVISMVVYPFAVTALGFPGKEGGLILGATIHNISQVVGAGAVLGREPMEVATMTKMLRVALLVPVMLGFSIVFRDRSQAQSGTGIAGILSHLPAFLYVFVLLAALNMSGVIPPEVKAPLGTLSSVCVLTAVVAMGIRTNLVNLKLAGMKPIFIMTAATIFLFVWMTAGTALLA